MFRSILGNGLSSTSMAIVAVTCIGLGADPVNTSRPFNVHVKPGDWPQLGGTPHRNNATDGTQIPTGWDIETGKNVKWTAKLGHVTQGSPVVANGKVYVGTTNLQGHIKRYPRKVDVSVLLCFRESDGEFLWQYSSEKLPSGRIHDWPNQGLYSSPIIEGDRLWFVTNRGEVVCLDTAGFSDGENDGPFTTERPDNPDVPWQEDREADVVWKFDMMKELGVRQLHRATCAPTIWGDVLFICTSNAVGDDGVKFPASEAPSFMAMDKRSGKVLWTDNAPGRNILQGQWSSPAAGVFDGVPQVLFGGGDGWLYSFRADRWGDGKPEFLWKFDGNPKDAVFQLGSRGNRNSIVAMPVIDDGLVYLAMGQDPEHGEGVGHLWCIDPKKRGDVSPQLVVDQDGNAVPHRRIQATAPIGDLKPKAIPNPNSAVVWHFDQYDLNGNGKFEFEETMHRSTGSPVIKNDLLIIADFAGLVHCVNAKTGKPYWAFDMYAACWPTCLIVGKNVYAVDEDGDVAIFSLSDDFKQPVEVNIKNSIYTLPVYANNVLYIANKDTLFAIEVGASAPKAKSSEINE